MRIMNFCSQCGARVAQRIPAGDNVARYVCDACGTIHYRTELVVGCVPEHEGAIVLCRRAIEPRHGFWTVRQASWRTARRCSRRRHANRSRRR